MAAPALGEDFTAEDCEVQEQCILAPGHRLLLRFDGVIQNLGLGDLVIGSPENNPLFIFSECHGHYHLKDIMTFELLDPLTGEVVRTAGGEVVSRKQGFCLKDTDPIAGDRPRLYDCENQGLTPGWADIYGRDLGVVRDDRHSITSHRRIAWRGGHGGDQGGTSGQPGRRSR